MSHRAIVAIPADRSQDTYDLYHSRNGGAEFKLHPILDSLQEEAAGRLQQLPHRLPGDLDIREEAKSYIGDNAEHVDPDTPIVNKEPMGTGIKRDDIFDHINYLLYDVLYILNGSSATTYYLSWCSATMQSELAMNIKLEYYPLSADHSRDDVEPYYKFENNDFLYPDEATKHRADAPPLSEIEEELEQHHMGMFRGLHHHLSGWGEEVPDANVVLGGFRAVGWFKQPLELDGIKHSRGAGVAIKTDLDRVPPEIAWADVSTRADEIRWHNSLQWNKKNIEEENSTASIKASVTAFIEKNQIEFGDVRASGLAKSVI